MPKIKSNPFQRAAHSKKELSRMWAFMSITRMVSSFRSSFPTTWWRNQRSGPRSSDSGVITLLAMFGVIQPLSQCRGYAVLQMSVTAF